MENNKNILYCILDWGLGHATRSIPIIEDLISKGNTITIGADKAPYDLLKQEFPDLNFVRIPSKEIKYTNKDSSSETGFLIKMFLQSPAYLKGLKEEQKLVGELVNKHCFDLVISDGRLGCYSTKIKSILVHHQLFLKSPIQEKLVNKQNHKRLNKFNEIWVTDYEDESKSLSGNLSHFRDVSNLDLDRVRYLNPISRFNKIDTEEKHLVILLSGPEPQRTLLEEKLKEQAFSLTNQELGLNKDAKIYFILGKPSSELRIENALRDNIIEINHLPKNELNRLINSAKYIVSRSGYTTVMDLYKLGKKALFIPTPGQTEQEYLSKYLADKKMFYSIKQTEVNLIKDLKKII